MAVELTTDVLVIGTGPAGASAAVVPDGTPPAEPTRDPELYAHSTSRPGAKVPHAWLTAPDRTRVSTLDLGGHGRFTVLTGIGGECWTTAAERVGEALGITVHVVVIGPGQDFGDPYGRWADVREIDDGGAILTRPDNYVGLRTGARCGASAFYSNECSGPG